MPDRILRVKEKDLDLTVGGESTWDPVMDGGKGGSVEVDPCSG